jgi:hypothetical protein
VVRLDDRAVDAGHPQVVTRPAATDGLGRRGAPGQGDGTNDCPAPSAPPRSRFRRVVPTGSLMPAPTRT